MDLLTHIFLPLTALYVLKREAFNPPYHFLLVLFAILPLEVAFHSFSFSFLNDLVQVVYGVPNSGFNTYGIFSGFGVASMILFVIVYLGMEMQRK